MKAKCSRKWAVPFVLSVSARLPASIQTPTVDVCAHGECSVAICKTGELGTTRFQLIAYRKPIVQGGAFRLDLMVDGGRESSVSGLDGAERCTTSKSLIELVCQPPGGHGDHRTESRLEGTRFAAG